MAQVVYQPGPSVVVQQPAPVVVGSQPATVVYTGGQHVQYENYCGPISWIIGLFLFPCICFCPVDTRPVHTSAPGATVVYQQAPQHQVMYQQPMQAYPGGYPPQPAPGAYPGPPPPGPAHGYPAAYPPAPAPQAYPPPMQAPSEQAAPVKAP